MNPPFLPSPFLPPFLLTIKPIDLDNAIAEQNTASICRTCLFAQALRRQTGGKIDSISFSFFNDGKRYTVDYPSPAGELMTHFDNREYNLIRAQLPVTIEIPRII